ADTLPPAEALARLAGEPLLGRSLVSVDLDTTVIQVTLDREAEKVSELEPRVRGVFSAAAAVPLPGGIQLVPTGVPWVRVEVVDLMWSSQVTYLPVVAVLFALTLGLMMRRVGPALAPLVTVLLADVWVLGVLIAAGETLNVLSVLVPTLVVVIGVADGVHLVSRYREELGTSEDRAAAMARTMRHMVLPCFLTTFTTAAGFISLLVADTSVIRAFGVQCAVAMVITFVAIISMLPVLLAFIPAERVRAPRTAAGTPLATALTAVHRLVAARPGATLCTTAVLTALAAAVGLQVQTNSSLLEMYREGMPTWHAVHLIEKELAGVIPVMVHVQGEPGSMLEPEMLRGLDTLERTLAAAAPVRWTASPATVVRTLHRTLTGEDALPQEAALISQEVLLAEISGDRSLEKLVSPDRAQARVLAVMTDAGGRVYVPLRSEIQRAADAAFAGTAATATVTGDGFLAASGVDSLIGDLLASLGLVFAIITLTFAVLLRDMKLALVAAVPNLVPLLFTLATLVAMGADLQTSNVVSFTVAVGLAVDDTIHFIVRYKQERRAGRRVGDALHRTTLG
ncbi:MAG: MMPL family transporter, partial [Myxococcota bacterium]|nr:MMPL family transporter [Myxococcota bacterium]